MDGELCCTGRRGGVTTDWEGFALGKGDSMEGTTFDEFWKLWPRKCSKKRARVIWDRLSEEDHKKALEAVVFHVKHWKSNGTEINYIPHASTWLYGERWEDELPQNSAPEAFIATQREACEVCDGLGWVYIKSRAFRGRCAHGEKLSLSIPLAPELIVNNS